MTAMLHGFVQGFNAQIDVTDDHLILATSISQDGNDNSSLERMMNAAVAAVAAVQWFSTRSPLDGPAVHVEQR